MKIKLVLKSGYHHRNGGRDNLDPTVRSRNRMAVDLGLPCRFDRPRSPPASCTMGTGSFLGVKRLERRADHPPPSVAGLPLGWNCACPGMSRGDLYPVALHEQAQCQKR